MFIIEQKDTKLVWWRGPHGDQWTAWEACSSPWAAEFSDLEAARKAVADISTAADETVIVRQDGQRFAASR